ncbi:MFS transporter [Pleomassaria siparia CBS 279.74]|uniref:MFS transporter n=1 Tax=Pleomassaria siparia CBS 279.74 TaxID=1314801 RepID=A0A6G1K0N1_9PLEO|nr:MFS transporter [Pleomassaria siparia CBS 279.74]
MKSIEKSLYANGETSSTGTGNDDAGPTDSRPKKKSKIAELWKTLELDAPTVMMMGKAALPPAISLAMYQADIIAKEYSTLGYLIAVISILGFCIMPRAKFIQTMTMNIIGTCLAAALNLLMLWSSVQARLHTTPVGSTDRYNSSQSAVCAVWLFFQIWLTNTVKAKLPQLAFPAIMYSIFVNVAATSGPQFATSAQVQSFIKRLLISFLTAHAIATGVALLVIPVTCRKVVTKEIAGYITLVRGTLQAHKAYFQSLETSDIFDKNLPANADGAQNSKTPTVKPEVAALKKMTAAFTALHGKLYGDLPFAKREIAWGKLTPEDFEGIFKHLRAIMVPLVGLGSLMDLFDRYAETNRWNHHAETDGVDPDSEKARLQAVKDWNEIMTTIHEPLAQIIQAMDGGLHHTLIRLQLIKAPKKKAAEGADPEAKGDTVEPGDRDYASYFEAQCDIFSHGKVTTLQHWVESKGIKIREDFFLNPDPLSNSQADEVEKLPHWTRHRNRRQLYLVLYIIFLLNSVSRAVLDLVKYADERDQATAKTKFINPGKRRFEKWIASIFKDGDSNHDNETTVAGVERSNIIYMGEAYNSRKDPEHNPPANTWEKFGNFIRGIAGFLRSSESAFGFRTACATMSIGIVVYLRDTQVWFIKQRIVWAMIMVAISMVPTSGATVYTFILRIAGTTIAMVVALLAWYIPDQNTAGVIVFLWFFSCLGFYFPLKQPSLVIAALISVVTATMIIGYELEVRKIGAAIATSNGQPFYDIYLLAPYRLATVAGGLAVAFFWTVFPYPVSEHSVLRQKLGGALYLSANYYSIMHETVMARIRGDEGDPKDPKSPSSQLTKARNKVFAKQMLTLQALKMHAEMVKWEFPLGGKFPREEYNAIIQCVSNITNDTTLIGYASNTFSQVSTDPTSQQWFHDFQRIVSSVNITSHEITSLLALLSSSITSGQPLPPYLTAPESFELSTRMESVDKDILSLEHITEPGYAAFAVIQISTRCIHMDIEKLLSAVKKLVGELDFSFHTVSTQSPGGPSSSETLVKSLSHRGKLD